MVSNRKSIYDIARDFRNNSFILNLYNKSPRFIHNLIYSFYGYFKLKESRKIYNEELDDIKQEFKKSKKAMGIDKVLKLSDEDAKLAQMIKEKLRKTAETIVEIGEYITKATDKKPKGYKDLFYETIGMSPRSAQRYMQIARHVKIQALKEKNLLEGKTMTDLLCIIAPEENTSAKSVDANRVANSFYSRYKDDSETLKDIMRELQKLINDKYL